MRPRLMRCRGAALGHACVLAGAGFGSFFPVFVRGLAHYGVFGTIVPRAVERWSYYMSSSAGQS